MTLISTLPFFASLAIFAFLAFGLEEFRLEERKKQTATWAMNQQDKQVERQGRSMPLFHANSHRRAKLMG